MYPRNLPRCTHLDEKHDEQKQERTSTSSRTGDNLACEVEGVTLLSIVLLLWAQLSALAAVIRSRPHEYMSTRYYALLL